MSWGRIVGKSNERDVLMGWRHFGVREKPGNRETPRNPRRWTQLILAIVDR